MADRDDGRLLARVELDDAAGPIVAQPRHDDPVAGLEARPGVGELVLAASPRAGARPAAGQASRDARPRPGQERGLPRLLGLLAELLDQLPFRRASPAARGDRLGPGDKVLGQVQPAGDLQGVGLPDVADMQPIPRLERLDVELDRGVLGAGVGEGIGLEVADVRGDDRPAADTVELVEDRAAQGRPFRGIGSRAQLVEQDQRCSVALRGSARSAYVRRERGKRLLEALLIADVGQDVIENGN